MGCDIFTENLIKGIIVSHGKTGVTVDKIIDVYSQYTNERFPIKKKTDVNEFLNEIPGIFCHLNKTDEPLWFVKSKNLLANPQSVNNKNKKINNRRAIKPIEINIFKTNNESTCSDRDQNNNSFNYIDSNDHSCDKENIINNINCVTGNHQNNNYNKTSRNNSNDQNWRKSNTVHREHIQRTTNKMHKNNNYPPPMATDHRGKKSASFYDYELVGDDFFLALACIELDCRYVKKGGIRHCGLCISGQSIHGAANRLKQFENMKIIINIGSIDILHGHDLVDMRQDFSNLIKICDDRNIQVTITTLAPLGNKIHLADDVRKLNSFNEFLLKRFCETHQVIDIRPCMLHPNTTKLIFDCYQPVPRYMTGSNQPHLLWNRIGRQRVLKLIKKRIVN